MSARTFVAEMLEHRPDPYAGADLGTSRRVTAALLGLSALLALAFLPLEPVDRQIGGAGWALGGVVIAAGLAGPPLVIGLKPGFRRLLAIAYAGVAGVAVLDWLAGGSSSYELLFVLWLGAGSVQPPRRAFVHLAAIIAALALPLLYVDDAGEAANAILAEALLLLAIGSVLISYLFDVRRQRAGLRAGAEVARRLARVDPLTGLGNRRAFDEALTAATAQAHRERKPLAVGLVDLDDLKRVNDRHGHLEGDRCLNAAARAMERAVRTSDRCFRWGGDEFAVLLPETTRAGAEAVLGRMVERIGRVCTEVDSRGLTLSWGAAELEPAGSAEDLLAAADLSLHEHKAEKRR